MSHGGQNAPPVTTWRTAGEPIDLRGGAGDGFMLRAQVHEAWDAVRVLALPTTTVAEVKRAALAALIGPSADPAEYMAKRHGTELRAEEESLERAGVRAGSTVLVHARRRRPVR